MVFSLFLGLELSVLVTTNGAISQLHVCIVLSSYCLISMSIVYRTVHTVVIRYVLLDYKYKIHRASPKHLT